MPQAAEFIESFIEEEEPVAAAPVSPELRAVVPHAAGGDIEQLERESSRHRVLLLRGGAVIAVTTIISVGGALFIHALFAGVIVLGIWFPWLAPVRGSNTSPGLADKGGASGGFTILGIGPDDNAAPSLVPASLGQRNASNAAAPTLPPLPEVTSAQIASQLAAPDLALPTVESDLGSVTILTPAPPATAQPAVPSALSVSPPTAPATPAIASAGTGVPGNPARGTDAGNGGGEEDRVFGLLKGDGSDNWGAGGSGKGKGAGNGNGIDRGMSAADRDPALLNLTPGASSELTIPMQYQLKPPPRSVRLVITILPDGKIGGIKLAQSCGVPDVDQLVLAYAANFQFSPGYRDGKAITSEFFYEQLFHPLD